MTEQEFRKVYPLIAGWIKKTLAQQASAARPVASFGFSRLPHYYDAQLLASSMVVLVPKVPMPPLSAMGLDRFREFEQMDAGGTTYLNMYFVRADQARNRSISTNWFTSSSGGCLARRSFWRSMPTAWRGSVTGKVHLK
jgi:hypothetical protein